MKTRRKHTNKSEHHAVVELFSTFLLLSFTVIFFAGISYFLLSAPQPTPGPIVSITAKMNDNNLVLEHQGGEPISLDANIFLRFNDTQVTFHAYDYADAQTKEDGLWGLGEKVIYPIYRYHDYLGIKDIDLMIVNKETDSSFLFSCTPVIPTTDLSIEISVDQEYPRIGTPVLFTITVRNNGNINVSGIQILFEIPEGLTYVSSNTTNGWYDNITGVWNLADILPYEQSVDLRVTAYVNQVIPSEFTHLLIIQDGSGSIRKSDWNLAINAYISVFGNSSVFPQNGVVELSFVQFGGNAGSLAARVEIPPTIVTNTSITSLLSRIQHMEKMVGLTATACGMICGADAATSSYNFSAANRQVVLVITDGKASSVCNIDGDCQCDPPAGVNPLTSAVQARNYLLNQSGMTPMNDELDVIAVHVTDTSAYTWFKDALVWPQPGYFAPPFHTTVPKQGFVCNVSNWEMFAVSLQNVLTNVFSRIQVSGDIIRCSIPDPKIINNNDNIVLIPHISS